MSDSLKDLLRERVKDFPKQSGVYLMKSHVGKIIYIGKAKILRSRVLSYFSEAKDIHPKVRALVGSLYEIEYILTKTEVEAFLLEASLIKKHKPKYNIRLRDDKSYPYIKLSWKDEFPRLYLSRKVHRDGAYYFGPYTKGSSVFLTIRFLNRTFKVRDCTDSVLKTRKRPCMSYQIGRCSAPCVGYISAKEYRNEIEGALVFLKGQNKKILKLLHKKMTLLSDQEHFEQAAKVRDSLNAIKMILEKQSVINEVSEKDQDVIGYFGDERGSLVEMIHIRAGRMIGNQSHFLPQINLKNEWEDAREWLIDFLNQYYESNFIPNEVITPIDFGRELNHLLQEVLKERSQMVSPPPKVRFPTDEETRKLLEICLSNAESHFQKYVTKSEDKNEGLKEIQSQFQLLELPLRIECYDISHFQGVETVASQVVFEEGAPARDQYRRYKLRTVHGADDYASMLEVLKRRFQHNEWEDPQLVLIDGGKGQLNIAVKALMEVGKSHIPIASIAKSRTLADFESKEVKTTEERFFLPGRQNPVLFKTNSVAFQILTGLRDEAHRFAINYHRKLRENTSLESELDLISGLGEKRKNILLKHFQSIEILKSATPLEISKLKGFNLMLAERIFLQLHEADHEPESSIEEESPLGED
ncbi:MAG TPA: excinuclease ABC subunit UvrC [Pseudobdellovibrionaceae bacterium]|nr:excinuclease ABC subunit UvrC [Pseudobdellovibrionaceae bacterium]